MVTQDTNQTRARVSTYIEKRPENYLASELRITFTASGTPGSVSIHNWSNWLVPAPPRVFWLQVRVINMSTARDKLMRWREP